MLDPKEILNWAEIQKFNIERVREIAHTGASGHYIHVDPILNEGRLYVSVDGSIYLGFRRGRHHDNMLPKTYLPNSVSHFNSCLKGLGHYDCLYRMFSLPGINSISDLVSRIDAFAEVFFNKCQKKITLLDLKTSKIRHIHHTSFIEGFYSSEIADRFIGSEDWSNGYIRGWISPDDTKRIRAFGARLKKFVKSYLSIDKHFKEELGDDYNIYILKDTYEYKIVIAHNQKSLYINVYVSSNIVGIEIYHPTKNNKLKRVFLNINELSDGLSIDVTKAVKIVRRSLT